ncbi:MAG: Tol-Pal system beta propeller repeat protein TolB [Candidatus Zixiibacteriota bacterium]
MRKIIFTITLAVLMLAVSSIMAQSGLSVRDVQGRLSPKDSFEETKIAVDEVRYIGVEYIDRQDSILLRNCGVILRNDLDFSPFFEGMGIDSFYMKHMEIEEMTVTSWKWLGVRYLVKLDVEFPRNEISVGYRLYAVETGRELKKDRYKIEKTYYRSVIHRIANDIVKFLTGDNGIFETKIVYSKQLDSAREIFISDYDGKNPRQLTANGSINILPAISPDGETVFYTTYRNGSAQIYMINVKTGIADKFSDYPGLNAAPAVSPDGKTIACVLTKDGNSEIYLLDRKGKIIKRLTNSRAIETSPTWSPDGRMIAFTSDRTGSPQIYVMDKEGLNVQRLTYQGGYNESPNWSPKGNKIVFVSRNGGFDICSIDITGKNFQVLADIADNEDPYVSPDGNHIVFTSTRLGPREIYMMDIFGISKHRVTSDGGYSNPAWMPIK